MNTSTQECKKLMFCARLFSFGHLGLINGPRIIFTTLGTGLMITRTRKDRIPQNKAHGGVLRSPRGTPTSCSENKF